jgi:cytochrome b involved in lipid metabolism
MGDGNEKDERAEQAKREMCQEEDAQKIKFPAQGRFTWIAVVVLGLISVVGYGVGACLIMEPSHVSMNMDMHPHETSEVVPEHDSVGISQLLRFLQTRPSRTPSRLTTPRPTPRSTPRPTPAGGCKIQRYTLANIAQNNDASKCWLSLYGVVYDLTGFVGRHPGGPVIIGQCGKDATTNFDRQHGVGLLRENGFSSSIIGRLGSSRGVQSVPCNQINMVAVTGTRRE